MGYIGIKNNKVQEILGDRGQFKKIVVVWVIDSFLYQLDRFRKDILWQRN